MPITQESVEVDRLRPNPWNSNVVTPENQSKIEESLRRNGFVKPIIVRDLDGEFEILGGEHRWTAAKNLGLPTVPIFNLGKISDTRAKEIGLIDNARYGADDNLRLAEIFESIGTLSDLQLFLPMSSDQLDAIVSDADIALDELGEAEDEDESAPDEVEPASTKIAKTHALMRFKVPIADSERISDLITRTRVRNGFNTADELTNAGDALVHLLLIEVKSA